MAERKTRLLELLDLGRSLQQQFIAGLDPATRNAGGTWENWSVKDELAHISAWQLNALARIAALMHQEPLPDFSDYHAINRRIYDTNRDRTLAEIAAEGDRAYAEYRALITATAEDDLTRPVHFSEKETSTLAAQLIGNCLEHPALHYADYYRRHGDLPRALQVYDASVAAVADWPDQYALARYNQACFYALNGQAAQAITVLGEALRLRPDLVEWSQQDTDLETLRQLEAYQALYAA
jgi:hypothetical protein